MTTYAETQGQQPMDWFKTIVDARDNGISREAHTQLTRAAQMWTTCACGNQCSVLPRHESGRPLDMKIASLGCDFAACIEESDWEHALKTLEQIEHRAQVLIDRTTHGQPLPGNESGKENH